MNGSVWDGLDYTSDQLLTKKEKSTKSSEYFRHYQGTMIQLLSFMVFLTSMYTQVPMCYALTLQISCLREMDDKQLEMSLYRLLASIILVNC